MRGATRSGVSLVRWCCRALRGNMAMTLFVTADSPVRGQAHQSSAACCLLTSTSLGDTHIGASEQPLLIKLRWFPRLKGASNKASLAAVWTVCLQAGRKSSVKVLWCTCESPTEVLNSTVNLHPWLIKKQQGLMQEPLYVIAACRFCGQ